ncbi:PKD domain-containing protein [Aquipuribacter sp. MA13-6]|uniref:PKD domain-containing protein n=1 Tax=unclassified Aquipuribacter TaxID=2635084 RepID=UPI003EEE74FC
MRELAGDRRSRQVASHDALSAGSGTSTGPITLERYVYACGGNSYATDPAINVPCEESFQFCPPGPEQPRQFFRYTTTITGIEAVPAAGARWTLNGVLCLPTAAGDPAAAEAAPVPVVTLADFRSLPLPAGQPTIQPGGGEALIRARTNVYVEPGSTDEQTFDITLLGTPVTVRATPVSYTWDFGDGSDPLVTEDPGAPYPDLTTWHAYSEPGDVGITLTTTYTGAYSVAGGPFIDIAGTAEISSEPVGLELISTTNRLTG